VDGFYLVKSLVDGQGSGMSDNVYLQRNGEV
jgi:hypothetical protein